MYENNEHAQPFKKQQAPRTCLSLCRCSTGSSQPAVAASCHEPLYLVLTPSRSVIAPARREAQLVTHVCQGVATDVARAASGYKQVAAHPFKLLQLPFPLHLCHLPALANLNAQLGALGLLQLWLGLCRFCFHCLRSCTCRHCNVSVSMLDIAAACNAMLTASACKWACVSSALNRVHADSVEASPSVPLLVSAAAASFAGMAAGVPPLLSTAMLLADTRMAALLPVRAHSGRQLVAHRVT
jgi:hypothetical protein